MEYRETVLHQQCYVKKFSLPRISVFPHKERGEVVEETLMHITGGTYSVSWQQLW